MATATLKSKYGFNYHGSDKETYLTAKPSDKYDKIEIQLKILQLLIQMQLSSDDVDFVYYGSNSAITIALKKVYPKLTSANVITYLQRLAAEDLLTIHYNTTLHEFGKPNYYRDEPEGEIRHNVFVDFSTPHYRQIKLNMDYIALLSSVIDPSTDEVFLKLPRHSVARRFIKKRCMTAHKIVKDRYEEIKAGINDKLKRMRIKFKNYKDAIKFFIKYTTNKYYLAVKLIKNHIFANLQTETDKHELFVGRVGVPSSYVPPPINDDTGELTGNNNKNYEVTEEQSKILDDFYRNIT